MVGRRLFIVIGKSAILAIRHFLAAYADGAASVIAHAAIKLQIRALTFHVCRRTMRYCSEVGRGSKRPSRATARVANSLLLVDLFHTEARTESCQPIPRSLRPVGPLPRAPRDRRVAATARDQSRRYRSCPSTPGPPAQRVLR